MLKQYALNTPLSGAMKDNTEGPLLMLGAGTTKHVPETQQATSIHWRPPYPWDMGRGQDC